MPRYRWSDRNEMLNALYTAIQHGTYGRIRNLSLELVSEHCVVVCADSSGYYAAQLLIQAAKRFGDEHRVFAETRLVLSVRGHSFEISIAHLSSDVARQAVSTHDADFHCQRRLPGEVLFPGVYCRDVCESGVAEVDASARRSTSGLSAGVRSTRRYRNASEVINDVSSAFILPPLSR